MALLCGGIALSGHSAKATARLVVNQSPEPFSNIGLSLGEDAAVVGIVWLVPRMVRSARRRAAAITGTGKGRLSRRDDR